MAMGYIQRIRWFGISRRVLWRYTDRVGVVFRLANEHACIKGAPIEPQHLLLGMLDEGTGVGVFVLKQLKVDLFQLAKQLDQSPTDASIQTRGVTAPFSTKANGVVDNAVEQARLLNRPYIGTEHLLLALLHDSTLLPVRVVEEMGINYQVAFSFLKSCHYAPAPKGGFSVEFKVNDGTTRLSDHHTN